MQVQKDDLRCLRILTYRHLIQYSKHKFRLLYLTYIDLGLNLQDPFIRYWPSIQFHVKSLQSCQTLCDPMDCSLPGSLPMGFSRQEYWNGFAMPSSGDLPNQGIEPVSTVAPHCRQILHHWATRETLHQATVHGTQRVRHHWCDLACRPFCKNHVAKEMQC